MKTYQIAIREALERVVEVQAESLDDAINQVWDDYGNEKIVLGADDHIDTEVYQF